MEVFYFAEPVDAMWIGLDSLFVEKYFLVMDNAAVVPHRALSLSLIETFFMTSGGLKLFVVTTIFLCILVIQTNVKRHGWRREISKTNHFMYFSLLHLEIVLQTWLCRRSLASTVCSFRGHNYDVELSPGLTLASVITLTKPFAAVAVGRLWGYLWSAPFS